MPKFTPEMAAAAQTLLTEEAWREHLEDDAPPEDMQALLRKMRGFVEGGDSDEWLDLSVKSLKSFPPAFFELDLSDLSLSSCESLTELPLRLAEFTRMKEFRAHTTGISEIPGELFLAWKSSLHLLGINRTKNLTTLPPEIGECKGLTSIMATESALEQLPPALGHCTKVRLSIAGTKAVKIIQESLEMDQTPSSDEILLYLRERAGGRLVKAARG